MGNLQDFETHFIGVLIFLFLCFFVIIFKPQIGELISRLKSTKIGNNTLNFGEANFDKTVDKNSSELTSISENADNASKNSQVNWSKFGNVFWLAHDLMWTVDVTLRQGPLQKISIGLGQCIHHAKEINLSPEWDSEDNPAVKLLILAEKLELMAEEDLSLDKRKDLSEQLVKIVYQIGYMAERQQEGFRAR